MAQPTVLLAEEQTADQSSYTTPSVSPGANSLMILAVCNTLNGGTASTPTVTGCGLTWDSLGTLSGFYFGVCKVTVFRAMGASPSAGALTIDFSSTTQKNCGYVLLDCANMDTSGPNGTGAVAQAVTVYPPGGEPTSANPSVTLSSFSAADNGTLGVLFSNNETISAGSGFTELGYVHSADGARAHGLHVEWKAANDTSVDWTAASSTWNAIALELVPQILTYSYSASGGAAAGGAATTSKTGQVETIYPSAVVSTLGVEPQATVSTLGVAPTSVVSTLSISPSTEIL